MGERTDRELVELAQCGDLTAIGELFSRYWRAARAAAFGVTGELASAEDVAAEAFKQALVGMRTLLDPDRFGSWLRTIVVRKARIALQNRHSALDALSDNLTDQNEWPDKTLERIELVALIQHAMRELPIPLREGMALVYFEGYDSESAAQFLDIPAGTLRRRLHDSRIRLRKIVEQTLQENRYMNEKHQHQIQKIKTMVDNGEIYKALRGSLALRPPPSDLINMFLRWQMAPANDSQTGATRSAYGGCPKVSGATIVSLRSGIRPDASGRLDRVRDSRGVTRFSRVES